MQRNWIGRSEGAEVDVPRRARPGDRAARVHHAAGHAVRRDVLRAGARAPAGDRAGPRHGARGGRASTTCGATAALSEVERGRGEGRRPASSPAAASINPVNGEAIPVWVADYVLMEYGTGAIMAVPGARRARLRVRDGVRAADPPGGRARATATATSRATLRRAPADEVLVNSGDVHRHAGAGGQGARSSPGWRSAGSGDGRVAFRLRDWLLSRQRYWGCPIPIVHCESCGVGAGARRPAAGAAARRRGLRAQGPLAAGRGRGLGRRRRARGAAARPGARPTRWTRSSTRPGTTCATPTRRTTDRAVRPRRRRHVAAGRPVHRRRRARDPAPDVRALLHQGAVRPGASWASRSRSRTCSRRG